MTFQQWIEEDFGGAVETPDQKAQARYGSKKAAYDFGQGEMLSDLRHALGWQGGTVAEALAEVKIAVFERTEAFAMVRQLETALKAVAEAPRGQGLSVPVVVQMMDALGKAKRCRRFTARPYDPF